MFFNSGKQIVIRLITPLRMSYEESYAKAFPFDKMVSGVLDPEMIEDTVKMVNEAIKDKIQVNLIINNRAGGNAPLIAQKIADRLRKERQQRLL
jgi:phosphoheptose isomerase